MKRYCADFYNIIPIYIMYMNVMLDLTPARRFLLGWRLWRLAQANAMENCRKGDVYGRTGMSRTCVPTFKKLSHKPHKGALGGAIEAGSGGRMPVFLLRTRTERSISPIVGSVTAGRDAR
jgi:hypothetical protein